jgi:hypothetical protein
MRRQSQPPIPTLAQLAGMGPRWLWLVCRETGCGHTAPAALTPFVIRWGADASSDVLRRSARCTCCGHKGAGLQLPSWVGLEEGFAAFPVHRDRRDAGADQ